MPAKTSFRVRNEIEDGFIKIPIRVVVCYVFKINLWRNHHKHSEYQRND